MVWFLANCNHHYYLFKIFRCFWFAQILWRLPHLEDVGNGYLPITAILFCQGGQSMQKTLGWPGTAYCTKFVKWFSWHFQLEQCEFGKASHKVRKMDLEEKFDSARGVVEYHWFIQLICRLIKNNKSQNPFYIQIECSVLEIKVMIDDSSSGKKPKKNQPFMSK